jgi:DNA-binding XRE family transcriptional regulator
MNVHTDAQIIHDSEGKPVFVVVPYERWIKQSTVKAGLVPNEVVGLMIRDDMTPFRAWREYLGLTQKEVAERADMTQAALSQIESGEHKARKATREKLARALGLTAEQLV